MMILLFILNFSLKTMAKLMDIYFNCQLVMDQKKRMIPLKQQHQQTRKEIIKIIQQRTKRFKEKRLLKINFIPMKTRFLSQGQDFEEIFENIKQSYKKQLEDKKTSEKVQQIQNIINESIVVHKMDFHGSRTKLRFNTQPASHRSQGRSPKGKLAFQRKQKDKQQWQFYSFRNKTQYVGYSKSQQNKYNCLNKNQIKCNQQRQKQRFLHATLQSESSSKGSTFSPMHSLKKLNSQQQSDIFFPSKAKYIIMKFNNQRSRVKTQAPFLQKINGQSVAAKRIRLDTKLNETLVSRERDAPIAPW